MRMIMLLVIVLGGTRCLVLANGTKPAPRANAAERPAYRVVIIKPPQLTGSSALNGAQNDFFSPNSMNGSGQVVGAATYPHHASGRTRLIPSLWSNGRSRFLNHRYQNHISPEGRSDAESINDKSQIVGAVYPQDYGDHYALLWKTAVPPSVRILSRRPSIAYSINNRGQIVGWSTTRRGRDHAYLWHKGTAVDLGVLPGDTDSYARDINNKGQVVGRSTTTRGRYRTCAFLWQNGKMTNLFRMTDKASSEARALNESGTVIGVTEFMQRIGGRNRGIERAWVRQKGRITYLPTLGGSRTVARDINNRGQIVGSSSSMPPEDRRRAVLWERGRLIDLNRCIANSDSIHLSEAVSINDKGQIAVNAFRSNNQNIGVLLVPL